MRSVNFPNFEFEIAPCSHPKENQNIDCLSCGQRACPHGEPLHFHADGCPSCALLSIISVTHDSVEIAISDSTKVEAVATISGRITIKGDFPRAHNFPYNYERPADLKSAKSKKN
jgi:hypothetical protein